MRAAEHTDDPPQGPADAMPCPEDFASPDRYLAALDDARDTLARLVFPPRDAGRLWRALRGPFEREPPPVGDGWRDRVLAQELEIVRNEIGASPDALLHEAVRIGRPRWAERALAQGADALGPFRDDKASSLLGKAVQLGRVGVVARILDAGVRPDVELPLGWTPFALAVFHRQPRVARLLADRGADLSAGAERGQDAFRQAAESGDLETLSFMEERGARVARDRAGRADALVGAARRGHLDVVRHLLEDGVSLERPTLRALLRAAVSHDRTEILEELIARGIDPLQRFDDGHLLRDVAADGLVATLRRLLHHATRHGVEREAVEEALREADLWLHERRTKGREEAVRLLRRWLERNPPPRERR